MSTRNQAQRRLWPVFLWIGLLPLFVGQNGCPGIYWPSDSQQTDDTDDTGDDSGDTGQPLPAADQAPDIVFSLPFPSSNVATGDAVAIAFNANDPENNFTYQLFYDNDGVFDGDEVAFCNGTCPGSSLIQATWSTQGMAAGRYYICAQVTDGAGNVDRASTGPISILGGSSIQVTFPASSFSVNAGNTVNVVFQANDSHSDATIDVFYDNDDNFTNGVSGMIASGLSQELTSVVWNTTALEPGIYFVGASIGRPGATRLSDYAPGQINLITGEEPQTGETDDLSGLELLVTQPAGIVTLDRGAATTIKFFASDSQGGATVDLYYVAMPLEQTTVTPSYTGNEPTIVTGLSVNTTSYRWVVDLEPGIYRVGASIGRSADNRIADLAEGKILVASGGSGGGGGGGTDPGLALEMQDPQAPSVTVAQGKNFAVTWSVDASAAGTAIVYAEPDDDNDGVPDGEGTRIYVKDSETGDVLEMDIQARSCTFSTLEMAQYHNYFVGLIYTPDDGAVVTRQAPGLVRVKSRFRWMGQAATDDLRGAVFEGVNRSDFAGSSMTAVTNLNADESEFGYGDYKAYDDFVIVSQFGKPGWDGFGIEGAGVGEAYVIFGGLHLSGRHWKLNATGVTQDTINGLPGMVLTGVQTANSSPTPNKGDRAGISGVIAVPDQDEDGLPELAFNLPYADSVSHHWLEGTGQFRRGGLVLISSQNNFFLSKTITDESGGRMRRLDGIGQAFRGTFSDETYIAPLPSGLDQYGCKGADYDGDDVPDDGDGSGKIDDARCSGSANDCDDNCVFLWNPEQEDADKDGIGDVCDPCPLGEYDDDGKCINPNPDLPDEDEDGDGVLDMIDGEPLDNCLAVPNPGQEDQDGDGIGDFCDSDVDGDGFPNDMDNCAGVYNDDQVDINCNGVGDVCEGDQDGDGWPDGWSEDQSLRDNCPLVPNPLQGDRNEDGVGDACSPGPGGIKTKCGNKTQCNPKGSDGCAETAVDGEVGFYPPLADEIDYPRWGSGLVWDIRGSPSSCVCPDIEVFGDILIKDPWKVVGGWRPWVDTNCNFLNAGLMSSGFVATTSVEHYGMRLLGQAEGDCFGQSLSFVDDMLLVGAPKKANRGQAYMIQMRNLEPYKPRQFAGRDFERTPGPRPYQYTVGKRMGSPLLDGMGYWYPKGDDIPLTPTYYISNSNGRSGEDLGRTVQGIADFNADGLGDVVIGAPYAFNSAHGAAGSDDSGAVYLLFRRMIGLEGDRDLHTIELADPDNPNSRFGVMIRGRAGEQLGEVVGTGADVNGDGARERLDFNHDGLPDLVLGNYHHDGDRGEIVIVFGNRYLRSPEGGFRIEDDDPDTRDLLNDGLGAVIKGENPGDTAGFNIAYAGDFDGDGWADLLISAPLASVDVDADGDGVPETLERAGKVYLIFGSNQIEPGSVLNLADVGTPALRGVVFAGQEAEDQLGGGEEPAYGMGGIGSTGMRARSISWAGDVNGDGKADILLGAPKASVGSDIDPEGKITQAGIVYLIFGFADN